VAQGGEYFAFVFIKARIHPSSILIFIWSLTQLLFHTLNRFDHIDYTPNTKK